MKAQALETQLASRGSRWAKALKYLSLMFPTETGDNASILEQFGEQFKWGGPRGPMELLTETLHKLGLDEHKSVDDSADGEMLFQILRQRVPEAVAIMCLRNKAETWQAIMETLQQEFNLNRSDAEAEETVRVMTEDRKKKPKYAAPAVYVDCEFDEWVEPTPHTDSEFDEWVEPTPYIDSGFDKWVEPTPVMAY